MEKKSATPRIKRAIELRDAALKVIAAIGDNNGRLRDAEAKTLGLEMATRKWPPNLRHQVLDFGLDVWTPSQKVLNINWDNDGGIVLISFRRGDWEDRLLSAATIGHATVH
jgi:hypothetical protein